MPRVAKFILLPAKAERHGELLEILHSIRRVTGSEPGTQQWILHEVDGQPNAIAMYEIYDDDLAADHHTVTNAPLTKLLPRLRDFLDGEPILLERLVIVATKDDD